VGVDIEKELIIRLNEILVLRLLKVDIGFLSQDLVK